MFEYLDEYQVTGAKPARIRLRHIKGVGGRNPVLLCLPLTNHNPALLDELVRAASEGPREGEPVTVAGLHAVRMRNADKVIRFCLKGWEDVKGPDGNPVAYTPDLGKAFVLHLAEKVDYQFKELVDELQDPTNFTEGALSNAETTAKNSERG